MKNSLEWLNSRSKQGEESICKLKDRSTEIRQYEEQKEKRIKTCERRLEDTIKCINIWIMGVPDGEETEKEAKQNIKE